MLTAIVAAIVALSAAGLEKTTSPFAPPPKPAQKIVRLLAPSGAFSGRTLRAFERETGYAVAYDAYGDPARIAQMMKEPYDVVVLPGPALAQAIAAGQLLKLDKSDIPNARRVAPQVALKLAAYDASGAYALAWGWSATGLIYDAVKAPQLLGAAPNSWADALAPEIARKLAPCGVALPDDRDEMFMAAWRLMGVDPLRLRDRDVTGAADVIIRARAAVRLPISRDPIGAIAGGAVCLTFGGAAQAEIATRRSHEGGAGLEIRFAEPREGGPIAIDALAQSDEAAHPREASALIDFLLEPAVASKSTAATGLTSAEASTANENFRGLWPIGVYDARLLPLIEKEWARARAPELKEKAAKAKKTPAKPSTKPAAKPTRKKKR